MLVGRRSTLLKYLLQEDAKRYKEIVGKLGLRK
jgi:ribosomal protein S15P/S13E